MRPPRTPMQYRLALSQDQNAQQLLTFCHNCVLSDCEDLAICQLQMSPLKQLKLTTVTNKVTA
jgi:hypothetical protein